MHGGVVMSKKIFFFDIDGTLAIKNVVPEDTKIALKKLQELGHYVFICTGRPYIYAKYHFEDYVDGFICANGRYIVYKEEVLLDEPLTLEQVNYFVSSFEKLACGYNFNGVNIGYAHGIDADKLADMQTDYEHPYFIEKFKNEDIKAHMFDVHFDNQEHYQKILTYLQNSVVFNEHFGHNSADATIIGYDKGIGIEKLLAILKIARDDSYAFGDGFNDICMFKVVGHPIAMGNGVAAAKEASEYVTNDINDGGIYKALQYYKIFE